MLEKAVPPDCLCALHPTPPPPIPIETLASEKLKVEILNLTAIETIGSQ
jgi:hypothetical protein